MDSNLVKRIAFAAVAIPLAVGLVWLGGWPLAALVALIAVLGMRELFDIAAKHTQLDALCSLGPEGYVRTTRAIGGDAEGIPPRLMRHTPTLARARLATLLRSKGASWVNSSQSSVRAASRWFA